MNHQVDYQRRGARLNNRAVVLQVEGDYVLAHRKNNPILPFAVWAFDAAAPGAVCAGTYHPTLEDARYELAHRTDREARQ